MSIYRELVRETYNKSFLAGSPLIDDSLQWTIRGTTGMVMYQETLINIFFYYSLRALGDLHCLAIQAVYVLISTGTQSAPFKPQKWKDEGDDRNDSYKRSKTQKKRRRVESDNLSLSSQRSCHRRRRYSSAYRSAIYL